MEKVLKCQQCEEGLLEHEPGPFCEDCNCSDQFDMLSLKLREEIDTLILQSSALMGIKKVKAGLGLGLRESVLLYEWRYRKLKGL